MRSTWKILKTERQLLFHLLGFPLYNFSLNPEVMKNMSPLCFFSTWMCTDATNGEVFAKVAVSSAMTKTKDGMELKQEEPHQQVGTGE